MKSKEQFNYLASFCESVPGIAVPCQGAAFGSETLRVEVWIFAQLDENRLVVKLPAHRVEQVASALVGTRWNAGRPRPLQERLALPSDSPLRWEDIAAGAFDYVRSE
ncbi:MULTISPECIES: hypothetical protein [Actinomycetes]|uniref:hypothetical protein n=1 Tax=Streptomyces sp. L7 TaxID=3423954 RepID=UPI0038998840